MGIGHGTASDGRLPASGSLALSRLQGGIAMTHDWWRRSAATISALAVLVLAAASLVAQGKTEAERKVALTADAGSLDPYRDNSVVGVQLQGHLFDQLVDFRGPDFTQTPLVAERWENPDRSEEHTSELQSLRHL